MIKDQKEKKITSLNESRRQRQVEKQQIVRYILHSTLNDIVPGHTIVMLPDVHVHMYLPMQ